MYINDMKINDLSKTTRNLTQKQSERLMRQLEECRVYANAYLAGEVTLVKFIGMTSISEVMVHEVCVELSKLYQSQNELGRKTHDLRPKARRVRG